VTADIRDLVDQHRLVLEVDGYEAELQYRVHGDRLVIVHTEVPAELEGQGLAAKLVRAALAKAVAGGLTVVPWCPYARGWLEKHPDEAAAVTIDWTPPPED
jgi:hypothetical protein